MKKLITVCIFSLVYLSVQANIYRVNNNPGTAAQYTVAQAAHDACNAGDTLYIEGSTISYGTLNISKKINLIGPGYFLPQNPQTQVNPSSAPFTNINCNVGSLGSYITGLDVGYIQIYDNNIVLKRNYFHSASVTIPAVSIQSNKSGILITQNYITTSWSYSGQYAIGISAGCSNITVTNNYLGGLYINGTVIYMDPAAAALIVNNTIVGGANNSLTLNNCTFNNNIVNFSAGSISGANNSQNNNLSVNAMLDTTGGNSHHNQINVPMTSVFIGTGSTDGQYKLKAGSPAIAAGLSGENCGMFGGSDPYVLSGMPTVPSIYFFGAPTSGYGTLPVQVKITSHK